MESKTATTYVIHRAWLHLDCPQCFAEHWEPVVLPPSECTYCQLGIWHEDAALCGECQARCTSSELTRLGYSTRWLTLHSRNN